MPTASSSDSNPRTQLCLAKMEQAQIENKLEQSSFVCGLTVCPAVTPEVLIWPKATLLLHEDQYFSNAERYTTLKGGK